MSYFPDDLRVDGATVLALADLAHHVELVPVPDVADGDLLDEAGDRRRLATIGSGSVHAVPQGPHGLTAGCGGSPLEPLRCPESGCHQGGRRLCDQGRSKLVTRLPLQPEGRRRSSQARTGSIDRSLPPARFPFSPSLRRCLAPLPSGLLSLELWIPHGPARGTGSMQTGTGCVSRPELVGPRGTKTRLETCAQEVVAG
jgi:hypothetical protein